MAAPASSPLAVSRRVWQRAKRAAHLLLKVMDWIVAVLVLLALLGDGKEQSTSLQSRVLSLARNDLFDYVTWEIDVVWGKARQELFGVQTYLDNDVQRAQVVQYLTRLSQVQALEAQIERIYADPGTGDPAAATADLREQSDALRDELSQDQPLAEAIIEEQVSAVLADEGFRLLGQVLPPVSMHFSALPDALIISPRDHIEMVDDLELNPIPVEQREALEDTIDATLDVSSLVVPLGGLSMYPSMVEEPDYPPEYLGLNVARAFEVTAHEWSHLYLAFFPLGFDYAARPDTRIINETVATFFGQEIALEVMARYYPDLTPPVYLSFLSPPAPPAENPTGPPPFDFNHEMSVTRSHVDELLKQGLIDEAEQYMEAQRQVFVSHGYAIRKLNQAYFAFYGGYQNEPGAAGADPIGPAVEELRALSPDLLAWLQTVRGITTRDQLLAALDRAREQTPAKP
ncbi:MAG TPA: hypothetical protein VMT24_06720 [Aggregatilineaceae bacterium]|nr:hypothetical protein [Aggregatilineaceae bacterium]